MSVWNIKQCELIKDNGQLKYCHLYLNYSLSNKNFVEKQKLYNIASDIIIKRISEYFDEINCVIYYTEKNSEQNYVKIFIICSEGKECDFLMKLLSIQNNVIITDKETKLKA